MSVRAQERAPRLRAEGQAPSGVSFRFSEKRKWKSRSAALQKKNDAQERETQSNLNLIRLSRADLCSSTFLFPSAT